MGGGCLGFVYILSSRSILSTGNHDWFRERMSVFKILAGGSEDRLDYEKKKVGKEQRKRVMTCRFGENRQSTEM